MLCGAVGAEVVGRCRRSFCLYHQHTGIISLAQLGRMVTLGRFNCIDIICKQAKIGETLSLSPTRSQGDSCLIGKETLGLI